MNADSSVAMESSAVSGASESEMSKEEFMNMQSTFESEEEEVAAAGFGASALD